MKIHAQITALLNRTIGFDLAAVSPAALELAVRSRIAASAAPNPESYWEQLHHSEAELQALIESVVVPETWFFRQPQTFAALGRIATQEWLMTHRASALRALSFPCSTGEEPYSIAIALLEAGLAPHRFRVDGIDVSLQAVASAQRAVFGRNSFRGGDLSFRARYFREINNRYELTPLVRDQVRFSHGNLLETDSLANTEPYDVIFCRNVLIYFDAATQKRVINGLGRLLANSGTLFVGSAEAFLLNNCGFVFAEHARAFAFRKGTTPKLAAPQLPGKNRRTAQTPPPPARVASKDSARSERPPSTQSADKTDLAAIRCLADAGRLEEAARACERHLREEGHSAAAYYLLGLVRDAMGNERQAAHCYRKVIYLDPNHSDALLHLALLSERSGDSVAARRLQLRAKCAGERIGFL